MRTVPISYDVFNASANAKADREAEFRAMHRRPDALPLPEGDEDRAVWGLAWLSLASKRLARRRPAARARRAAG
jgi:hypothetical protein